MAVSAFKSTTKRSSIAGGKESDNAYTGVVPFQPSTPFNKRGHRRTQSLSDFNDATNSMHLDSLFQQGKRASSRYQSDCDSESDADSMYSRHTYRSMQNAEIGATRKAALQTRKTKREDKRRSPSVERSYKEIADFLNSIDDPNDADAEAPTPTPNRQQTRRAFDAQSDSESVFSRASHPRRNGDVPNETDSLLAHFDRARRIVDAQSDTDSVFTRLAQPRRRLDAQSDTESVFSRLTRPRQSAGLGPPRTGAGTQNGNGKGKGTRAGALRRSSSQVDLSGFSSRGLDNDQSDSESLHSSTTHTNRSGRHAADFGQSSSTVPARKKGTRQGSLRRSASRIEFSDNASLEGFMLPSRAQDDEGSPEEAFFELERDVTPQEEDTTCGHPVEEKTIRAVHTQNMEPRSQELDAISLYDAMRAEMRKAVSEIRSELEQKSVSKDLLLSTPSVEEGPRSPGQKEDDEEATVSEVRQEYAVKLEQSEKRAQDLWTQLAAEERRCLDLVKFVKELLPTQASTALQPPVLPPPPLRPMMGPQDDQQLVSQCLDADAQRYFDECVSLAGLDLVSLNDASSAGAGYQGSVGYQESESGWSVKDMPLSPRKRNFVRADERNVVFLQPLKIFCAQIEQNGKCVGKSSNFITKAPMNEDGLVLPWLQWETKLDYSLQEQSGVKGTLTASSSRSKSQSARHHSEEEQDTQLLDFPAGISGLGCLGNGDLSSCKSIVFGHLTNLDTRYRIDVETFVLQRSLLRHRIVGGRILICGGIRY
ncbi:unnamed protein product [Calypogeia fissa]